MAMLREVYELPSDHRWTAKAGYKILALERGAVVLEFPGDWHVQPGPQQVDIRDRATAAESACVLAVLSLPLPPVDWSGLPLASLLLEVVRADEREHIGHGPMTDASRGGLEAVWTEIRVVDGVERREARCRMCLARAQTVQCLLTFDFWPEDEARLGAVWGGVLGSLRLGAQVDDPTRGRRIA